VQLSSSEKFVSSIMACSTVDSLDGFKDFIGKSQGKLVVLYFWTSWAAPCVAMSEAVEKLAAQCGADASFAKV
jgi:thioredoxin-like negative regulator of GroEL